MTKKLLTLSLAGLLLLSFYMTSCIDNSVDNTLNTLKEREDRSIRLQETLKIIRAETDPEFVKRLNQINELLDEISTNSYGFGFTFGNSLSTIFGLQPKERTFLEKTHPLIENPDIALPLMFERLDNKKLDKYYDVLLDIYFIVFGKIKSAESIPYISDFFASVSENSCAFYTALWAAQEITSLKLRDEEDYYPFARCKNVSKQLRQWYEKYKRNQNKK